MDQCNSCNYTLIEFGDIARNKKYLINFLEKHGCVQTKTNCPNCKAETSCNLSNMKFDCKKCNNFAQSIRVGTFYHHIAGTIEEITIFVMYWLLLPDPNKSILKEQLYLSSLPPLASFTSYCKEICLHWCIKNSKKIGGENRIIEIFQGRITNEETYLIPKIDAEWVFCGRESGSNNFFFVSEKVKNIDIIISIIQTWVYPKSVLVSDIWKEMGCHNDGRFVQKIPKMQIAFVNPKDDVIKITSHHIWKEVMFGKPVFNGENAHNALDLAEFFFKYAYENTLTRIHPFFATIGKIHIPKVKTAKTFKKSNGDNEL